MKDTRIEDLAKTILQATSVKEVIDADGERMSVGSNRLRLSVTLNRKPTASAVG